MHGLSLSAYFPCVILRDRYSIQLAWLVTLNTIRVLICIIVSNAARARTVEGLCALFTICLILYA